MREPRSGPAIAAHPQEVGCERAFLAFVVARALGRRWMIGCGYFAERMRLLATLIGNSLVEAS
ncbi:MAG TPA: hypothetical protein PK961_01530 [bacterium]|nr:hypothetical protein [bacterium]